MTHEIVACRDHRLPMVRHCQEACGWLRCQNIGCELLHDPVVNHWKGDDVAEPESE